ncbi:LOG family protein [Leucobacter sp. HY1910]
MTLPLESQTTATTLREELDAIITEHGVTHQRALVRRILESGVGLGLDETSRLNLKITAAAVEEMRAAFKLFAPFNGAPKVTVFGSARTQPLDPLWRLTEDVAEQLAAQGWMVVTGAGPGIMEAAATGAGTKNSLGVSIRLPFEEELELGADSVDEQRVVMKYFFTRKLMLVKESRGFVCLPGGFGTMDEAFELLTLQQTGKMDPVPIVLLDRPGGTYWTRFASFITDELAGGGYIAEGDLDRVLVTDSAEAATNEVTGFWHNYDSLRWVDHQLVLRLKATPTDDEIDALNAQFSGLLEEGRINATGPLAPEVADKDKLDLPRIVFTPRRRAVGDLHHLIRALNALASATA